MQTCTRTGRLSCQKPNLQAFPNPKRGHSIVEEDGVDTNVRAIFTASRGSLLISADYSQIEMRVMAHLCGDAAMIDLFNRSEGDIYVTLARIIFNKKVNNDCIVVVSELCMMILCHLMGVNCEYFYSFALLGTGSR
jgi:DNA polymerase-1